MVTHMTAGVAVGQPLPLWFAISKPVEIATVTNGHEARRITLVCKLLSGMITEDQS